MTTRTTVIDSAEVFGSEGTLALQVRGYDVLHLERVDRYNTEEGGGVVLTDEEYQRIIDVIVEALSV